ncbi:hypothetical protein FRC0086_01466 [Corynebacterium diphtheriae]|nr:hypothetical protein FRC0086_01466 [Corynebacterium diphtheriae]
MSQTFAYTPSLTDGGLMYPNGAFGKSYDDLVWKPGSADKIKSVVDTLVKDETSVSILDPSTVVPAAGPLIKEHTETTIGDLREVYGESLNLPIALPNECKAYTASVGDIFSNVSYGYAGEFNLVPTEVPFDVSWLGGVSDASLGSLDDAQRTEFLEQLTLEYGKLVDLWFKRWGRLNGITDPQVVKDRFDPAQRGIERFKELAGFYNMSLPAEDIFVSDQVVFTKDFTYPFRLGQMLGTEENPRAKIQRSSFTFNSDAGKYDINITGPLPSASLPSGGQYNTVTVAPVIGESVLWDPTDPSCFVPTPAIDIEKYINGEDADEAPGASVKPGEDMAIRFDVTNTGNVPLYSVNVTDDKVAYKDIKCELVPPPNMPEAAEFVLAADTTPTVTATGSPEVGVEGPDVDGHPKVPEPVAASIGFMPVGSKTSCTATLKAPESGEHVNTGTVTGFGGTTVTDTDDAHATVETPTPGTTEPAVEETVTPTTEPTPVTETQVVTTTVSGIPVTETVVVTKEPEVVRVTDTVKVTEEVVTVKEGVTTTQTVVRDVPAATPTPAPAPAPKRVALAVTGANAGTVSALSLALLALAGLALALRRKA